MHMYRYIWVERLNQSGFCKKKLVVSHLFLLVLFQKNGLPPAPAPCRVLDVHSATKLSPVPKEGDPGRAAKQKGRKRNFKCPSDLI